MKSEQLLLRAQFSLENVFFIDTSSAYTKKKIVFHHFERIFLYSNEKTDMRTSPDIIVCVHDYLKPVRVASHAFQPAKVTIVINRFAGAIGATSFLALIEGTDCEFANVAFQAVSIGTVTVG